MFCRCLKGNEETVPETTETLTIEEQEPTKGKFLAEENVITADALPSPSNTSPIGLSAVEEEAEQDGSPSRSPKALQSPGRSPAARSSAAGSVVSGPADATEADSPLEVFSKLVQCYRHAAAHRQLQEALANAALPEDQKEIAARVQMLHGMYSELVDRIDSLTNPQTTSNWTHSEDKSINAKVYYTLDSKLLQVTAVAFFDLPACDPLRIFAAMREFDMAPLWVPYVSACHDIEQACDEIGYYQCTQSFNVGVKSLKMDSCQRRVYSDALDEQLSALWFMAYSEPADAKELDGRPLPPPAKGVARSPASLAATIAPGKKGGTRFGFFSKGDVPFRVPDWILGIVCKFLVRGFVKNIKQICDNEELVRRIKSGPRSRMYETLEAHLEERRRAEGIDGPS